MPSGKMFPVEFAQHGVAFRADGDLREFSTDQDLGWRKFAGITHLTEVHPVGRRVFDTDGTHV